jgi:hypothetical protein
MANNPYYCDDENRRELAAATAFNGIDYLEVVDHDAPTDDLRQRTLLVFCLKPVAGIDRNHVLITGGVRVKNIKALWAYPADAIPAAALDPAEDPTFYTALPNAANVLVVRTDIYGDYSTYRLALVNAGTTQPLTGFDPQLAAVEFSFKVECPSDFDCLPVRDCPPIVLDEPEIDYLAKDYESFRRLMLDRMSILMPNWMERNPADVQIMLTEVLAYVADQLSYAQDAAATEAYLGTAHHRVSVRRHTRLLDYRMHEGAAARTWVVFEVSQALTLPARTLLLSRGTSGAVIDPDPNKPDLARALFEQPTIFETMHEMALRPARHSLRFYTWGNLECCLSAGSTTATLLDTTPPAQLAPGDVLLLEEIRDPSTGAEADADPLHRHAVRLIDVQTATDPLDGTPIIEIAWHADDALPFTLCLSALVRQGDQAEQMADISVARANVVLAEHGYTLTNDVPATSTLDARGFIITDETLIPDTAPELGDFRPRLKIAPLAFGGTPFDPRDTLTSAASALSFTPDQASPGVTLRGEGLEWTPLYDLLASDRFAARFVVEMNQDRSAYLRFGDGLFGRKPNAGSRFTASYRVGGGTAGNIGTDVLTRVVFGSAGIVGLRNPLPGAAGAEPEALEHARLHAPYAFRTQERAVTEPDYADMTERHPAVQEAAAQFRWTGSWYTIFTAVDRLGGLPVDDAFKAEVIRHLDVYRMAGYDLAIRPPIFVPLELALTVCVKPGYFRADVQRALLDAFSSRVLVGGALGFFHPDNFTFGQSLYLSAVYQAALAVEGVESVVVTTFQRLGKPPAGELDDGVIAAAFMEVLRLDNSPNFPENGRIELDMKGGS